MVAITKPYSDEYILVSTLLTFSYVNLVRCQTLSDKGMTVIASWMLLSDNDTVQIVTSPIGMLKNKIDGWDLSAEDENNRNDPINVNPDNP